MSQYRIAIVFAAGKGSRLAPLTNITPKPLLEVANKSLLKWNLEKIVDLVDEIIIVVSYLGEQIINNFGQSFKGKKIYYTWQKNPKGGTLDALRTAIFYSNKDLKECNFLVLNADDIHGTEIYNNFRTHIIKNPSEMALSARIVEDKDRLKSLGIFEIDQNNNLVKIWEKPSQFVSNLANSGIYYLPSGVVKYINPELNIGDNEEYITTELFGKYMLDHKVRIISSSDMWLQISTELDLKLAEKFLQNNKSFTD